MFSRLHVERNGRDRGSANTSAAVAAVVVAVLAATAVACSTPKEEDRLEATSAPASEPDAAGTSEADSKAGVMSALKNAATAMEVWSVDNGGRYAGACGGVSSTHCAAFDRTAAAGPDNRLVENGLVLPPGVSVTVIRADDTGYCLQATHAELRGYEAYFASETGAPSDEPCT